MKIEELIKELKRIKDEYEHDQECAHIEADQLLLKYINNEEVTEIFDSIEKWYS